MGRMNTFMARILKDIDASPPSLVRGVGIDEHTALLLDTLTGSLQSVGVGTAYVCESDAPAAVCKSDTPLTFQSRFFPISLHYYSYSVPCSLLSFIARYQLCSFEREKR